MRYQPTFSSAPWFAFMLAVAILLPAAPVAAQGTPALSFQLDPSTIQVGRTRDVKITPSPSTDLTGFEVQTPSPSTGVTFEKVDNTLFRLTDGKRAIVVRVKVDQDADPQILNLVLLKKEGGNVTASYTTSLEITEFTPRPLARQPVPPGIETPVDAQFQPLSYDTTKDVFGRKVADAYYAVAVGLGNNTGFDLQITKLGFVTNIPIEVLDYDDNGKPMCKGQQKGEQPRCESHELLKHKEFLAISAIDSTMVRGSIEKEQNFGRRALALNLVSGVGTLTTGFLPFFKALGPRANFASFSSILNGQFKEGFNLAVPDLTIRHLNRLENNLVMDEEFILANNSEKNTVIFVPRSTLHPVKYDTTGKHESERKKSKEGWDDLIEIRRRLGRLVIVGRPVERYANREIVVKTGAAATTTTNNTGAAGTTGFTGLGGSQLAPTSTTPAAPAPSVTDISPVRGLATGIKEIKITGTNFTTGASVTFGGTSADAVVVSSSTLIRAFLSDYALEEDALEKEVVIKVTNPDGQKIDAAKKYTFFAPLGVTGADRTSGAAAGGETVKIFGSGFRKDAKVSFDGVELPAASVTVADDGKTITITTPPHAAGKVKVLVVNPKPYPTQDGKELTVGFTYNP